MTKLNGSKLGMTLGTFAALVHAVWALLIAIIPNALQSFVNWVTRLHMVQETTVIQSFSLGNAVLLVVMAFIVANIVGRVFAAVWNWTN